MKSSAKISAPVLLASLGVLGALALAKFGWDQLSAAQGDFQLLEQEQTQPGLAAILTDPDGLRRTKENAKKIQELQKQLETKLEKATGGWRRAAEEAGAKNQPWSKDPGPWKDELIRVQGALLERARNTDKRKQVEFADDFYLGLDSFRQRNPTDSEVPELARELQVSRRLLELLMEARAESPEVYSTICRVEKLEGPTALKGKGDKEESKPGAAKPGPAQPALATRLSYRLEMQCSPEVLYAFLSRLVRDPWLFVPLNLEISNPVRQFPSRSEKMKSFTAKKEAPGQGEGAGPRKLLEVLAGKEAVQVSLTLEYLDWNSPGLLAEFGKAGGKP